MLRFAVPLAGEREPTVPEMVLDLAPYKRYTDNFEGIVRLTDNSAALIIDNDSGGFSSPNALFRVQIETTHGDVGRQAGQVE